MQPIALVRLLPPLALVICLSAQTRALMVEITDSGFGMSMPQNSDEPLISVVTASFNALEGLKQTVASVAAQHNARIEHIIADGGSDDGSAAFLAKLGERVRYVSEPDNGIADALNKGIAMATGDYVLVLQAEDRFARKDSAAMAAEHLKGDADIVAFEVVLERDNGKREKRKTRGLGWRTGFKMTSPHQGMLVRRDLYSRIGGFDLQYHVTMDYEWLLRARSAQANLVPVRKVLSIMPATGVSTRQDWESISFRLNEDKRLQKAHARGGFDRITNAVFWKVYWPFKWLKVKALGR